jgi:hypothetical protein
MLITIAQDFLYTVTGITMLMVLTSLPRPWRRRRAR